MKGRTIFVVSYFEYAGKDMMSVSTHLSGCGPEDPAYHETFEIVMPEGEVRFDGDWARELLVAVVEQL